MKIKVAKKRKEKKKGKKRKEKKGKFNRKEESTKRFDLQYEKN